jgi:hypothetical protein
MCCIAANFSIRSLSPTFFGVLGYRCCVVIPQTSIQTAAPYCTAPPICLASRSVIQRAQGLAIHDAELVALVLAPRMQCLWGHSLHPVDEVNLEHQIKHLHPLLSRNPLVLGQEDSSVKLPSSLWLLVESRAIPIHSTVHERHCFVLGELAFSTWEGGHLDLGGTVDCNAVRCIAEPTHQGKQRQRKPQVNVLLEGCNLIVPLGC